MSVRIGNSYKNTVKKLARAPSGSSTTKIHRPAVNRWKVLEDDDTVLTPDEQYDYLSIRLPKDVINIIISYLPVHIRINNLRVKHDLLSTNGQYRWKYCHTPFRNMPADIFNLNKLCCCAKVAIDIIKLPGDRLPNKNTIGLDVVKRYRSDKQIDFWQYKRDFVRLIVYAIFNYPLIYSLVQPSDRDYERFENIRVRTYTDLQIKLSLKEIVLFKNYQAINLDKLMLKLLSTVSYYKFI